MPVALLLLVAALFLQLGCSDRKPSLQTCDELLETYFHRFAPDDVEAFAALPSAEQYRVYICGRQYIHPPRLSLVSTYARVGPSAVPILRERLVSASDDETVRDIVQVLAEMNRLGAYNVGADADLMAVVQQTADAMRDENFKGQVDESIRQIRRRG